MRLFSLSLLLFASLAHAGENESQVPKAFDTYWMVFLKKGPHRDQPDAERQKIQNAHLAHLRQLYKEGKSITAGPFEVEPEAELRGIVLFPGTHKEDDVRAWATSDPAVKAGVLVVEVLKWWTPKGHLMVPTGERE